nr:hypothetical protein [Ruegeria sp. HKCCA5763]
MPMSQHPSLTADQSGLLAAGHGDAPDDVLKHPGMIADTERRALCNLTRDHYRDGSTIIDAGAFLGASTKAFLRAIEDGGFANPSVHTYEYGRFSDYSSQFATEILSKEFHAGENFGEMLKSLVDDRHNTIQFNLGDIRDFHFSGPEISIAFLDVLKSTSLMDAVYDKFFPYFADDTVLYQQDYFHPFHPWIACSMAKYQSMGAFSYLGRPDPEFGAFNAAVFVVKDLAAVRAVAPSSFRDASKEEVLDWMNTAIGLHDHPFEKLNVIGLRSAAVALFDKDEATAQNDFRAGLRDNGIADLLDHPRQQHHIKRVNTFLRQLVKGKMRFAD